MLYKALGVYHVKEEIKPQKAQKELICIKIFYHIDTIVKR